MARAFIRGELTRKKPFENLKRDPFYSSSAWINFVKYRKSLNPVCEVEGCNRPTHTVDHKKPIREGGDSLTVDNTQCLCRHHNFSKTGKQAKRWKKLDRGRRHGK